MTVKKGRTIWVSDQEYVFISQAKDIFKEVTGAKLSWGAYLVLLSMGGLAGKCLDGVKLLCPDCGGETDMTLYAPAIHYHRKKASSQRTERHSQTPEGAA